jgi:ribosomal protein S8
MVNKNYIINRIILGFKYKKKKIIINNINKTEIRFLKNLIKLNIINIIKIKKKFIIFFKYFKNKPIFKNIISMNKTSNLKFISLNNIIKINKSKNWIFFINTSKGLINNFEAEKNKVGGVLILKLWN